MRAGPLSGVAHSGESRPQAFRVGEDKAARSGGWRARKGKAVYAPQYLKSSEAIERERGRGRW